VDSDCEKELIQDIAAIHAARPGFHFRSYKTRRSRLDKYRAEIEFLRFKQGTTLYEIYLWLRRKHHVRVGIQTISDRLQQWEKE